MNYLSHAALSQNYPLTTLGNVIADHVKGPNLSSYPESIVRGIKLHRAIDQHFDNHPEIIAIRAEFSQGLRRFSGIVIDFWFDHLLALQWNRFYSLSLSQFQSEMNQLIREHWGWIPLSQRKFFDYLIEQNLFLKYQRQEHIEHNLQLVGKRLRRGDRLQTCFDYLQSNREIIDGHFESVYKEMTELAENFLNPDDQ